MRKFFLFSVLLWASIYAESSHTCPRQALYLVHKGQVEAALDLYEQHFKTHKIHDTEFLHLLGLTLLEQGSRSNDPETQLMAAFGSGIALNDKALPFLHRILHSSHPKLQLIALNFLSRYNNDEADQSLLQALRSNYLIIRLEALHQIAQKKLPKAVNHIESLMGKVDSDLLSLFPQLIALLDDKESFQLLKKLLAHPNEEVRIEAIHSVAETSHDDLLSKIRILSTYGSPAQLEAASFALGILKDTASASRLVQLSSCCSFATVRLAAYYALFQMGHQSALLQIKNMAKQQDLFATALLGQIPGNQETLKDLLLSSNFTLRLNAAISLLHLQDVRALPLLREIFVKDQRDWVFTKSTSPGKSFSYWKAIPSGKQQFKDSDLEHEVSLHFRESLLEAAVELPEETFLNLVRHIFDKQQNELVPLAITLLEQLQTKNAVALLKQYRQRLGAPLIRHYCNLALYRIGEEDGPYGEHVALWIQQQVSHDLIQLRPVIPWEIHDELSSHQITAHETSRLLIESYEALTRKQDNNGINRLLEAIKNGNQKNKYALAGLLIRASL